MVCFYFQNVIVICRLPYLEFWTTPPKKRAEKERLMMPTSSFGGAKSAKSGEREITQIFRVYFLI
jgi:hypothetical protein